MGESHSAAKWLLSILGAIIAGVIVFAITQPFGNKSAKSDTNEPQFTVSTNATQVPTLAPTTATTFSVGNYVYDQAKAEEYALNLLPPKTIFQVYGPYVDPNKGANILIHVIACHKILTISESICDDVVWYDGVTTYCRANGNTCTDGNGNYLGGDGKGSRDIDIYLYPDVID